jgi:hypothetical protein
VQPALLCVTHNSSLCLSTPVSSRGFAKRAVAVEAVSKRTSRPPQAYGAEQIQVCTGCTGKLGLQQLHHATITSLNHIMLQSV